MKMEIKIPVLGESISQVTIGTIFTPTGSQVAQDDELLEVETDKLNQVLYAPNQGIITLTVNPGDVKNVGDVIGFVDVQERKESTKAAPISKLAKEWQEELQQAELQQAELPHAPQPEEQVATVKTQETRKSLSTLKKAMAKRLLEAAQTTAMLTTFNEADMSEIIKLRELYKEPFIQRYKTKLGFMSFFVKACASALAAFPEVNSYLEADTQVFRGSIDIAVAIASARGLVVPVLRNADKMSFAQIEQQIDDFAERAKNGTLKADELKGGGFTITNGGLFGSMLSTPILNPPQAAILGMHKITKRAIVVNDAIVIRPMMYLALSYDHRILDGKEAVSFLVHIKNIIEDPHRLELGV